MKNLKKIRLAAGLTPPELSSISGVSSAAIYAYEAGKRDAKLSKLIMLADALKVSLDELARI